MRSTHEACASLTVFRFHVEAARGGAMTKASQSNADAGVVSGEFFTDGATYVMRFKGSPISGVGPNPQAAYEDLVRAQSATGELAQKLDMLARDQQSEQVRASLIRAVSTWLIVLTVLGGVTAGVAAVSPKLASDFAHAVNQAMAGSEGAAPAPDAPARPATTP